MPGNTLVLCHLGPSPTAPTLSGFVLKLETYLRMTEIPYTEEFTFNASSKGKMPYIKDNGKEVADSNFIVDYLNESLSENEKAISLAFQRLIEENLYWTVVYFNWFANYSSFSKQLPVSGFRKTFLPLAATLALKPKWKDMLHGHGMGRHSQEEILEIMSKDLRSLSVHLGSKQYFMGDEPTEIDASLFGMLGCFLYASPGSPHKKMMKEELTNLAEYTERMKGRFFPDWDEKLKKKKGNNSMVSNSTVTPS